MKNYLPLKLGFINILIALCLCIIPIIFSLQDNIGILILTGILFLTGVGLSITGLVLVIKNNKPVSKLVVLFSLLLNLLLPFIIVILLVANLKDFEKLFL